MQLRPLGDFVIVEPDKELVNVGMKETFIALPDKNTVQKVSDKGKVIKAGPACKLVKTGDRIRFPDVNSQSYRTPFWYVEDNKKYQILREQDIDWIEYD